MKIDTTKQLSQLNQVTPAPKAKPLQKSGKITASDAISISDDIRSLPDLARKTAGGGEIRQSVLKHYAGFVDKPLSISDQNILSAIKRSLIT